MLYPDPVTPTLPPWSAVIGFILGALTGSFLNMLIWRLPRGKSLIDPSHSICPICNHRLTALDLMPILSWLRTGGKCRHCEAPIAKRYLYVEILVGALFAGVWLQTMTVAIDPHWADFFIYAAAVAILVAIIYIDWELYIIPDELNAALLLVGLIYGATHGLIVASAKGAFLGWALIWGFVLLGRLAFGKDAMGDGDIKMMRGVGALLGPTLLLANVGLGVLLGLVGGIIGIALESRKPAVAAAAPEGDDAPIEATPIKLVLLGGFLYLFCIDILALFIKPLRNWIYGQYPEEAVIEEDEWKPSATTIPFGPYLAAGALICIFAGAAIERGMKSYWDNATGATPRVTFGRPGRTPRGLVAGLVPSVKVEQSPGIVSLLPRDGQVIECL